jgi:hypothetical protein
MRRTFNLRKLREHEGRIVTLEDCHVSTFGFAIRLINDWLFEAEDDTWIEIRSKQVKRD